MLLLRRVPLSLWLQLLLQAPLLLLIHYHCSYQLALLPQQLLPTQPVGIAYYSSIIKGKGMPSPVPRTLVFSSFWEA